MGLHRGILLYIGLIKNLKKEDCEMYVSPLKKIFYKVYLVLKGINSFYYICHIDNLKYILEKGILCRNDVISQGIDINDISNKEVQKRREDYHNYVPLFFNPRNPMMYKLIKDKKKEELCVIAISLDVLFLKSTVFSDGNIGSNNRKIYKNIEDLKKLDWQCITSKYWTSDDISYRDGKRKISAEVLVKRRVWNDKIKQIYVCCKETEMIIRKTCVDELKKLNINVCIKKDLFFDAEE